MSEARVRLSFYLMVGNSSVLQSWPCSYVRITEGKIVFQTIRDYRMHSFSLTRVYQVEIKPWVE